MLNLVNTLLKRIKESPIASAALALCSTCLVYSFNFEMSFADTLQDFEKDGLEMLSAKEEYQKASDFFELWKKSLSDCDSLAKTYSYINAKETNEITQSDILTYAGALTDSRAALSGILINLSSSHFNKKIYIDLTDDINNDATYLDGYLKARLDFLQIMVSDLEKANSMKFKLKTTFESVRRFEQMDLRLKEIESSLEKALIEYNSSVRVVNEKRKRFKLKQKINIASWTYISGYVGGWMGLLFFRKRKRSSNIENEKEKN